MGLSLPESTTIVEVGLRDGLQAVPEPLATDDKLRIVDLLLAAGCREIEAVSFAHPRVLPQLADAEAVMRRVPRDPGIVYRGLSPNPRGTRRALESGVDQIVALVCVDEKITELNQRSTVARVLAELAETVTLASAQDVEVIAAVAMSFFAYGSGVTPLPRLYEVLDRIHALGIRSFYVADSAGLADPRQVHDTITDVRARYPDCRVGTHLHTRGGMALANTFAALLAGVDWLEGAFCGIGGDLWFPGDPDILGNTPTEDLVAMCGYLDVETGIDLDRYRRVVAFAESVTGRASIGYVTRGGSRAEMSTIDWDEVMSQPGKQIPPTRSTQDHGPRRAT